MVVSKQFLSLFLALFCISLLHASADQNLTRTQIFLDNNMKQSLVLLGKQIEICKSKEEKSALRITPKSLKEANITIDDFQIATVALNYNNNAQCIEKEMNKYMYHALIVYKLQDKHMDNKEILESIFLSLPSEEVLEALAKYDAFPTSKKEYFKKNIGDEPFDIVKVSVPVFEAFR